MDSSLLGLKPEPWLEGHSVSRVTSCSCARSSKLPYQQSKVSSNRLHSNQRKLRDCCVDRLDAPCSRMTRSCCENLPCSWASRGVKDDELVWKDTGNAMEDVFYLAAKIG